MLQAAGHTFNPFQENTWVVHDGSQAILVDPGCCDPREEGILERWLEEQGLEPVRLVLTHTHVDHVLGVARAHRRFGLAPELHADAVPLLEAAPRQGLLYGVRCEPSPDPGGYLGAGDVITLGGHALKVLHVPGHAPGHIALFAPAERFVIAGDVLFHDSIGRTDLPGGDLDRLLRSIREELLPLGDDVRVHCGHGPDTLIGRERKHNPFLR
jgi:glyoxylase-like metal-dependent hydrolase (beta-lactamase superfamily II)